jgi:hypothetical protein
VQSRIEENIDDQIMEGNHNPSNAIFVEIEKIKDV